MTEKRFVETISTGIITDTVTGKEYNCEYRVSDEFLELINTIADENEQLKSENEQLRNELKQILNDNEIEWLRNNTVWEQMPSSKQTVTKSTLIKNNGDKND